MAVTTQSTLTSQYQTYFSTKLLDYAIQNLVLDQFALKAELPKNRGDQTIRFYRPGVADNTQVQALTEGTPIATFRNISYTTVDVTLVQYGEAAKITDIVTMTALLDVLKQTITTMGEDCALHADTIVRNTLSHQTTGLTKRYSGGAANFAGLVALSNANGKITGADVLDAVTALQVARAPLAGAAYACMICPQVQRDLLRDTDIIDPAKYQDKSVIAKGEVGMAWGARIITHTNPFIEDTTEGTYANSGNKIYSSYIVGRGAYGTPKLAGTQSPLKPSLIINDKADKSDPLNQFMTAGWKSYWAASTLNAAFGVTLRSRAVFV
jgi:N4-gp56 family major capsid protein